MSSSSTPTPVVGNLDLPGDATSIAELQRESLRLFLHEVVSDYDVEDVRQVLADGYDGLIEEILTDNGDAISAIELEDALQNPLFNDRQELASLVRQVVDEVLVSASTPAQHPQPAATKPAFNCPKKVFNHLLVQLEQSRRRNGEMPFKAFIERHGHQRLFELMKKSTCPFVWDKCLEQGKAVDRKLLMSLKEDYHQRRPGWYLVFLWKDGDLVWWRVYVGQSGDLQHRGRMHHCNARNPMVHALLYHTWRGGQELPKDVSDDFKLPVNAKIFRLGWDMSGFVDEDGTLFRNVGEMFFALMFQSLQPKHLEQWLPEDSSVEPEARGVNVALPIWQSSQMAFSELFKSPDGTVRAYAFKVACTNLAIAREIARENAAARGEKMGVKARAKLAELEFTPITLAARNKGNVFDLYFRNPDEERGDPRTLAVKCCKCGWTRNDPAPYFVKLTGEYVTRQQGCENCVVASKSDKMKARTTPRRVFEPVNQDVACISRASISRKLEKEEWCLYYSGRGPKP